MIEPSVETAEGRQAYRDIWRARLSPQLSEALDALDARDKELEAARAASIEECAAFVHELWEHGIPAQEFAERIRALTRSGPLAR